MFSRLSLFSRSLDFVVDDILRFAKSFLGSCKRRCDSQPQAVFIVYRHDEPGLAREIETVEMVSLGLEDHAMDPHAALNRLSA